MCSSNFKLKYQTYAVYTIDEKKMSGREQQQQQYQRQQQEMDSYDQEESGLYANPEEEEEEMNEEEVIQTLLDLGNQCFQNLGIKERIDDYEVFFQDAFYIQFFEHAFPHIDFSLLEQAQNQEEQAENIQALIDLLSEDILKYDLSHIKGEKIVMGHPEHAINFLQLAKEIALTQFKAGEGDEYDQEMEQEDHHSSLRGHSNAQQQESENRRGGPRQQMDEQMEDVSLQLEEGIQSADDFNMLQGVDQQQRQNNIYGGQRDQEKLDPLELAQEAMLGEADEADQEIEQIINKKQGWSKSENESDNVVDDNLGDEEELDELQYAQYQQQLAGSQDRMHKVRQQENFENDMLQGNSQEEDEAEEEGGDDDDVIHPDLIAAAQEMGLDLDSDQMRELQQYIVQQNIVDQSEEGEEYDQEDPNQEQLQIEEEAEIKKHQQQQEYDEEVDQEQVDQKEDDLEQIDLNELSDHEKFAILKYLEEEYDKNPEQFPFSKEQLAEIIEQDQFDLLRDQIRQLQQKTAQEGDSQFDENLDQIEHGQQLIEVEDVEEDRQEEDQQNAQMMMNLAQQQYQLKEKKPKKRPQTAKNKKLQPSNSQKNIRQANKKSSEKKYRSQAQQQFEQDMQQFSLPPGAENMDPQMLQQILLQQQQQQQQQQQDFAGLRPKKVSKKRPQTAKPLTTQTYGKYIQAQTSKMSGAVGGQMSERGRPSIKQSKSRRSKKAKKTAVEEQVQQLPDMPLFNEEYLKQLNHQQLEELLEQQKAIMHQQKIQQDQHQQQIQQVAQAASTRQKSKSRSASKKRSSSADKKARQQRAKEIYLNPAHNLNTLQIGVNHSTGSSRGRKVSAQKQKQVRTSATKKTRKGGQPGQGNSVMLNNFFPALNGQDQAQNQGMTAEEMAEQQLRMMMQEEQPDENEENMQLINEVPLEEEEGESQDITQSRKMQQHQMQNYQQQQATSENQQDNDEDQYNQEQEDGNQEVEEEEGQGEQFPFELLQNLSLEQLHEFIENSAGQLTIEQQQQLKAVLSKKLSKNAKSQKKMQYNNIYKILTENVAKAKQRLATLSQGDNPRRQSKEDEETLDRIRSTKKEYENLVRQHEHQKQLNRRIKEVEQRRIIRAQNRENKLAQLREKKFEEELLNQQKSLMYKRNAQQVRLCQKVYKLASDLEKNKLLEEKREFRETQEKKKQQKKSMVDNIEAFYRDKIGMLKERIENERFERKIAQQAQQEALSRMKREVTTKKKMELQKYLALLKQEDQKFDFQSSNLVNLEQEIIKLYKK